METVLQSPSENIRKELYEPIVKSAETVSEHDSDICRQ